MIRSFNGTAKVLSSVWKVQILPGKAVSSKDRQFGRLLLRHCNSGFNTWSIASSYEMATFRLSDYDCIGFDLDNTLLRYQVTNLVTLEYELLAEFLITKKGYSPKYLTAPITDKELDFMQKGLILDCEKGNVLKLNAWGKIQRACHGTRLMALQEIKEVYPGQRWKVTDAFCNDMLSTWNGSMSMQMRSLLDYFDVSSSLIFGRLVDTLDEENGQRLKHYNVWCDMLEGLSYMFDRTHFKLDKGGFFPSLKKNPEKYLHKCTPVTLSWLEDLKTKKKTFLITGSDADFANFTATFALGEDWRKFFDIVICYAKKPGFFTGQRPFVEVVNYKEQCPIASQYLEQGGMYNQGNWEELTGFLTRISGKVNPKCLYFGDNLIQDIYVPSTHSNCDTIAVIEEHMSEGVYGKEQSHLDAKILNSRLWGSYFYFSHSDERSDSLWGYIVKEHAKLCIPNIDIISKNNLKTLYVPFQKFEEGYNGYYPKLPFSIVSAH